jgi:Na+-driven multidrug efflux pump/FMN phosphatase YigB (HAD superfamily)
MKNKLAIKKNIKNFNKYFFQTFKTGKYLLIKYIGTAILMSVIAVLSNLLQVEELTYLNAVLAVDYFSNMISFGIYTGTNILANQNFSSKTYVRKFTGIGFKLAVFLNLLFVALLIAFPKFIMTSLTGFFPNDYTFYYLMCGYAFLSGIKGYVSDILKALQIFKQQFISDILTLIITIAGFAGLYFYGGGIYTLNNIAIVYIIANLIGLLLGLYYLSHNKIIKINLFAKTPIKLSRKQWSIIVINFAIEFVWEIGYFATSVLLLRLSDAMLNTYSYLETVLDLFNGFLFAYINITCIQIARNLGRSNFKKAFQHAKYSIYGTLIIWLIYFIASMALIYPIALGANDEYFKIMFTVEPCYTIIHLLRFLTWNFSSYMLSLGGKNKILLALEIFSSVTLVGLCFVAKYIPDNIPLSYLIITIPDIISLVACVIIFLRKKWMANINDDPNLLKNKIKCFIFDFDDTLYYGVNWGFWAKLKLDFFNSHFSHLSEEERKNILKKYKCYRKPSKIDLCQILNDIEGSCQAWLDYRDTLEMTEDEKKGKAIKPSDLKKFAKQGKCYIVSNARMKDIKAFSEYYKIDLSLFEEVIINDFAVNNTSKKKYYWKIMTENKLLPNQIMVIGNNYNYDIKPATDLKMNYYKCKDGFTYEEVVG